MVISHVRKRDGRIVPFEQSRITDAIHRAMFDAGVKDGRDARKLSDKVTAILSKRFLRKVPDVEDIQNVVEEVLKKWDRRVWAAYHEFRVKKAEIREARKLFGIEEKLTYNAMQVLERRYLLRDKKGRIVETPAKMFRRVARTVAAVEKKYGGNVKKMENDFFNLMSRLEFLPNSPTMFNAGTPLGQLSACFVLPVPDSLDGIFTAVKNTALIEQSGGGVGFSFSQLRPRGDIVRSTMGVASGPVSFMRVFDTATDVIKAGGKRRGAMMGILRVDHPDIIEFITAKQTPGFLNNFNISVAVTDKFMAAVRENKNYELINPRTGKAVKKLNARYVWNLIIQNAWKTGDPGVIFIDEINRTNPTAHLGPIEATNPCGEQPLHPYESCNLGSINMTKMLKKEGGRYKIDWEKLERTVKLCVQFLDNVIDANKYPLPEIERMVRANRRIGLGVMGWADTLILLGIRYDSNKALKLAEKVMGFIENKAHEKSIELGKKRGSFPNFSGSLWKKKGYPAMRNATVTTIAPTGTLSIIAGVSSGIEPLFAVSFVRRILEGRRLLESNRIFEQIAKERGFYSTELMMRIAKKGTVQKIKGVPKDVQKLFVTALDIKPEWHVRMQAAFQKHVDNSVSKTINFPQNAKPADVRKAYELAYKLKCKGITVYRYGSKPEQVLYIGPQELVHAESEFSGGCPTALCPMPS
ncbi:MAG: vitamin B12-dependent ribonucleotide reductase [Candidatus Aenigmatarchaeota archaeon]|nr:vitamin B12-dependent ribonucleotide reductase [Candidatus Aenigmarchaeota archaeon]